MGIVGVPADQPAFGPADDCCLVNTKALCRFIFSSAFRVREVYHSEGRRSYSWTRYATHWAVKGEHRFVRAEADPPGRSLLLLRMSAISGIDVMIEKCVN